MELNFSVTSITVADNDVEADVDIRNADDILGQIAKHCSPEDLFDALNEHLDHDEIFDLLEEVESEEMMKRLTKKEVMEVFELKERD